MPLVLFSLTFSRHLSQSSIGILANILCPYRLAVDKF